MPILPEYSLAGHRAVLASAGGEDAPILAQALAEAGAQVFVVARRQGLVDSCLAALGVANPPTGGGTVPPVGADLRVGPGQTHRSAPTENPHGYSHAGIVADPSRPQGVAQVMAALSQRGGPQVDILVNDARSFFARPFAQVTLQEWETVQARNVRATFLLCQAVGAGTESRPGMVRQGYGRIVNIISGLAERGMINGAAFSASQAAVLSLTRSLAVEWGAHNIRVNALGLGWSSTQDVSPEIQQQEQLVRYIPLRRRGHPRDIAPLLVYLCSEACDYTTGQPVYVDGGLNARA